MRQNVIDYGTVDEAQANNPEFLRENHANEEAVNPDRVIGQFCEEYAEKLISCYAPMNNPVFVTAPTANEDAGLLSNNAFLGQGLNPLLFEAVEKYNLRLQK